jgi:hypothetical protein
MLNFSLELRQTKPDSNLNLYELKVGVDQVKGPELCVELWAGCQASTVQVLPLNQDCKRCFTNNHQSSIEKLYGWQLFKEGQTSKMWLGNSFKAQCL